MFISPYKAILFDYDETLARAMEAKWKQHQHAAKQFYNHDLTDETIRKYWGMPFEPMIELFYDKRDSVENMKKNYFSLNSQYPKLPFEDSITVLTYLQKNRYWTGVVTSMTKESVIHDMKHDNFPWQGFKLIQGSKDSKFHKPDPRVFTKAIRMLKKIDITPAQTLYVGDDLRDMKAAVGAGINFVGIPNGLTSKEEFLKHGSTCISSLSELIS
jgi:phosphoglycolate phosphatase-like HAD superfamily hydrolase